MLKLFQRTAVQIVTGALVGLDPSSAQTVCIPPRYPLMPSTPELLREFRAEVSDEFSRYFSEAGEYLTCLNDARAQTELDIQQAMGVFQRLINEEPTQSEDLNQ